MPTKKRSSNFSKCIKNDKDNSSLLQISDFDIGSEFIRKMIKKIFDIINRGNNAEIKRKRDGSIAVYEVKKEMK